MWGSPQSACCIVLPRPGWREYVCFAVLEARLTPTERVLSASERMDLSHFETN